MVKEGQVLSSTLHRTDYVRQAVFQRPSPALEAKEGVTIERENKTQATITFQNYFRLYKKFPA